jgi:hypothetical protein
MNKRGYGSYFSQMVRESIREARKNFACLKNQVQSVALKSNPTCRAHA